MPVQSAPLNSFECDLGKLLLHDSFLTKKSFLFTDSYLLLWWHYNLVVGKLISYEFDVAL